MQEQAYVESCTTPEANGAAQPGLIFGNGRPGAWDAGAVGNPVVSNCTMTKLARIVYLLHVADSALSDK